MKKWQKILCVALAACLLGGLASGCAPASNPGKQTNLILNKDGSYGGSLSEKKYGKGAPLNGEYDVEDSAYYTVNNDYYNMTSTEERVIVPKFASYQQTMQDSSGLACLLMVLNYAGQDVQKKYNELSLLKKYEEVNGAQVYGNGTTEDGLVNLVESLGLGWTATKEDPEFAISDSNMKTFFTNWIKEGKFVLVRYQSPVGYGWKVVIGYDDLGNVKLTTTGEEVEAFSNDVIIFAEPYDGFDHCQDGYATERAMDFFVWWCQMDMDCKINEKYSYVLIDPNLDIEIDYQPVDETVKQTLYDIHLPLNPDGTYGGTRNEELYGPIVSGRGWWNHTDSNYYKINDFYNMGSEGSRVLLPNYTILQQTMRSSCGICAVNSVLSYYGREETPYDLELAYLNLYESTNDTVVKGVGSNARSHNTALKEWGYESDWGWTPRGTMSHTYEAYMEFMRSHLEAGRPIGVSTYLGSGHYMTVIGLDDMGTPDYIYDDVVICADPCDYWDGYQDGYCVYSGYKFYSQCTNSGKTRLHSYIVIDKK